MLMFTSLPLPNPDVLEVGDIVYLEGSPRSVGKVVEVLPHLGLQPPSYDTQVVKVHWIRKKQPVVEEVQRSYLRRLNRLIEYTQERLDDMEQRFKRAQEL